MKSFFQEKRASDPANRTTTLFLFIPVLFFLLSNFLAQFTQTQNFSRKIRMAAHSPSSPALSTRIPQPESRLPNPFHLSLTQNLRTPTLQTPWLGISIQSSNPKPYFVRQRPVYATVLSSLPTENSETVSSTEKDSNSNNSETVSSPEIEARWSAKAMKAVAVSELEARKMLHGTTGTEALLMGILLDATNQAAKVLQENGFTLTKVREECTKLLPESDPLFIPPERPPFTESAKKALEWAVDETLKLGKDREVSSHHLLLGLWSQKESTGHKILAALGFNNKNAEELQSVISKPGFVAD